MTDTTDIARRVSMTANGDTYEIWLDANRYHYRTDGFVVLMLEGMNHSYPRRVQSAAIKAALKAIVELHGQLEAERQRAADLVLHVNTQANMREKAEKSNAFLKEELAKLANFNPDWDMLEVCRESWREVVDLLKERNVEIAALKSKLANPVVLPLVELVNGGCILCGKLHPAGMQCPRLRVTSIKGEI